MSSTVLTELGLRHPGGRSGAGSEVGPGTHLAGAHRPVIDRALTLIGEALSADNDSPDAARLVAEIQGHRRALAEAEDPSSLGTLSETCFQAYGTELAKVRARQSAKYAEIGSLVSMMREAIAAIASCHNTFSSNLDTSTGKFEAMTHVNALRQLKGQLTTEVAVLKRFAAERQDVWRSTVSVFERRLEDLEVQLVETKNEAFRDPLTSVSNRRAFDHACHKWVQRSSTQFIIALLDLDNFKLINDTHGHGMGDQALVAVADALKSPFRTDDVVARIGGDEFGVLIAGLTRRQAELRLREMLVDLRNASPLPDQRPALTVSCGIAEFSAGDTKESLVHRADQALYDAKREGKNRVAFKPAIFIREVMKR